jgi:hypothetical protein
MRVSIVPSARIIGTKPSFGLKSDGSLYQSHWPQRLEELEYSRVWALLQVKLAQHGPQPRPDLTRALIHEMDRYTRDNDAVFLLVNWSTGDGNGFCFDELLDGAGPLNVVDLREGKPADWDKWKISGDGHPDPRAHRHAADSILRKLTSLGVISGTKESTESKTNHTAAETALP